MHGLENRVSVLAMEAIGIRAPMVRAKCMSEVGRVRCVDLDHWIAMENRVSLLI